jgi:transglutaminase-like putative cysteine protease
MDASTTPAGLLRPPPRLLLGVAFLFWGGMVGHPLVGLACAVLVEARYWFPGLRWDFDEPAYLRAWYLTVALILFGVITVWVDGPSSGRIYGVFTWMPVLLLPVQFVQSYGTRRTIPLYIFTLAASSKIERERSFGRLVESREISFGHITLTALLIAASLGREAAGAFFVPGIVVIVAWALRGIRGERTAVLPWMGAVLAVSMIGLGGQFVLRQFYDWLAGGVAGFAAQAAPVDHRHRLIRLGGLGEQKNSSRIFWRLSEIDGPPPALLRTASFNYYRNGAWLLRVRPELPPFEDLDTIATGADGASYQLAGEYAIQDPAPAGLPSFNLRGRVESKTLLPMPRGMRSLREPRADNLEYNSMGTLRIDPRHAVFDTRISWNDEHDMESPPWLDWARPPDLHVPADEKPAVHATASRLGLEKEASLRGKIAILRAFFLRHFRYSRHLDIPAGGGQSNSGAIGRFLTGHRTGHCEYFATATTLLLRDAGVPARYSVGFAVVERDADHRTAVVRGTHAHAWCEAWDAASGRWINVDLTPPDWSAIDAGTSPDWFQRVLDRIQMLREDFMAWNSRPGSGNLIAIVASAVGSLLAGYIVWRLSRTRRRAPPSARGKRRDAPPLPAPLRRLARAARRRIGPRPPGLPLGAWFARLEKPLGADPRLGELIRLHARLRFDPAAPSAETEPRLAELAAILLEKVKRL